MKDLSFDIKARDRTGPAVDSATGRMRNYDGQLSALAGRMAFLTTAAKGMAAGLSLAGTVAIIRDVAAGVAEIGDAAQIAGVSVKSFQELKYVAEQNRIPVDALQDGLKELSLRADEFIVSMGKSGSASEAFQRLGYSVDVLKQKLKDPSALFAEIIGRLQQLDKAAQIRIADEIFGGTGGERFVQLIEQGEVGIRAQIKAANDLGAVMDEALIKRAADIDRRFNQISSTVGTVLKGAIISATDSLFNFVDGFQEFQNQQTSTLEAARLSNAERRLTVENKILETKNNGALSDRNRIRALGQLQIEFDKLKTEDAEITAALNNKPKPITRKPDNPWNGNVTTPSGGSGRSSTRDTISDYDRVIEKLREEQDLLGLNETAQRVLTEQRRAGVEASSEQGKAIETMVRSIDGEREALERIKKAQEDYQRAAEWAFTSAGDAILSIVDKSASASDALKKLIVQFGLAAAQAALLNSGPLAGLFSNLLGGGTAKVASSWSSGLLDFRASGGPVDPWGTYLVGENGPEVLQMGAMGGKVVSNGNAFGGSGSGTVQLVSNITVTGTGDKELLEQLRSATEQQIAEAQTFFSKWVLPQRVSEINEKPRLRG